MNDDRIGEVISLLTDILEEQRAIRRLLMNEDGGSLVMELAEGLGELEAEVQKAGAVVSEKWIALEEGIAPLMMPVLQRLAAEQGAPR